MVGELFQHGEARLLLAVEIAGIEVDHFGGLVLAIDKGALKREIDKALDQFALPDRDLAEHQRHARGRLQHAKCLADALVGAVDLVEEQKARDFQIFELAQDDLQLRQLLLVRLADDHCGIDRGQRRAHVVRKFHRARTIDKSVAVTHEGGGRGRQRHAHLVMARLGAGIADRCAGIDAAGARNRARSRQDRFQKCGFTALERAHQCDAPWTTGTSDVLSHSPSPSAGARPVIGSATVHALPAPVVWQAGKNLVAVRRRDSEVESRSLRAKQTTAQFFDPVIPGHAKREL